MKRLLAVMLCCTLGCTSNGKKSHDPTQHHTSEVDRFITKPRLEMPLVYSVYERGCHIGVMLRKTDSLSLNIKVMITNKTLDKLLFIVPEISGVWNDQKQMLTIVFGKFGAKKVHGDDKLTEITPSETLIEEKTISGSFGDRKMVFLNVSYFILPQAKDSHPIKESDSLYQYFFSFGKKIIPEKPSPEKL
jgi:hypothetical protein